MTLDAIFSEFDKQPKKDEERASSVLDEFDNNQESNLRISIGNAQAKNPDQQAKVLDLAARYRLPLSTVENKMVDVEKRDALAKSLFKDVPPALKAFLTIQKNANVAHDDIDNLGSFEDIYKGIGAKPEPAFLPNIAKGAVGRGIELVGNLIELGGTLAEEYRRTDLPDPGIVIDADGISWHWELPEDSPSVLSVVGKHASETAYKRAGYTPSFTWEKLKGEITPANLAGYIIETGVKSLADMAATIATLPAYIASRTEEIAEARAAHDQRTDVDLDDLVKSVVTATVVSLLERIGAKGVFDLGAATTLKEAGKAAGEAFVKEGVTEFLQEALEYYGETVGTKTPVEHMAALDRAIAGAVAGGPFGGGIRGTTATAQVAYGKLAPEKVEDRINQVLTQTAGEQEAIDQIVTLAQEAKLPTRSREAFGEFVDGLRDKYDYDGNVYIDASVMGTIEGLEESPTVEKALDQIAEATVTNGDIVMGIDDFMADMVPVIEQLRPFIRLSPDSMSQAELENAAPVRDEIIRNLLEEANQNAELKQESDDIWAEVTQELVHTGRMSAANARVSAALYPAYVTTTVARLRSQGTEMTPREVYARLGFKATAGVIGGQTLEQAERTQAEAKDLPMDKPSRMKRAKKMGFDTEQVWYHGTDQEFGAFDAGKSKDIGIHFGAKEQAQTFSDREPMAVYLKFNNPVELDFDPTIIDVDQYDNNSFYVDRLDQIAYAAGVQDVMSDVRGGDSALLRVLETAEAVDSLIEEMDIDDRRDIFGHDEVKRFWRDMEDFLVGKGFDALVYENQLEGEGESVAVFNPNQIRSVNAAFDPEFQESPDLLAQEGDRGEIALLDNERIIRLTEAADLSTFLHESAHLFLDMERVFAQEFGGTDNDALLKWLGVDSLDAVIAGTPEGIAAHEKFAKGFEQYLFEGKAPSIALRNVFRTFKRWLTEVYKTLISGGQIEGKPVLNQDIRDVFDRLLATEEEIKAVSAQMQYESQFETEQSVEPREAAKETLEQKVLAQLRRQTEKWWKDELKATAESVRAELKDSPLYKAEAYIRGHKADRAAVRDLLGESRIPPRLNGLTVKEEGMDPDELAALVGFDTGLDLFKALAESDKLNAAALKEAKRQMNAIHGDILNDGTLEQEAQAAVHNEQQGKRLLVELRALNKRVSRETILDRSSLKEAAKDAIGRLTVTELMGSVERYHRAEVKSAIESKELERDGDVAGAAKAKAQQVLNFYLYREAREARDKVERWRKHLADVQRRKYDTKTVNKDYVQHLKRYAAAFDFRRGANEMQRKEALLRVASWVRSQESTDEKFRPHVIDPVLDEIMEADRTGTLDSVDLKYYKDMTIDEMHAVYDMARHLRFIGGKVSDAEKSSARKYHQGIADTVLETFKDRKRPQDKSVMSVISKTWQGYASQVLLHAEFQLRRLDGFKDLGKVFQAVKGKIDTAISEKLIPMQEKSGDEISALYAKYFTEKEMVAMNRPMDVDGKQMSKWDLISLGLNWGNESSRQAVLTQVRDGELVFTGEDQVNSALAKLDKRDMDFIQDVWDYLDTYKLEMGRIDRALTGTSPRWVEPKPIHTEHGTYRGGYYPLKYDATGSFRVTEEEIKSMFDAVGGGRFAKAHTPDGMLKERVGSGGRPIRSGMMVMHQHVNEAIQYIALAEPVAEVQALLNSKPMREAMESTGNIEVLKALDAWLKDVASDEIVSGDIISKGLRHVRTGFSASALGYNVGTMLMQPLGVLQSVPVVGAKNMLDGMKAVLKNPVGKNSAMEQVQKLSPFMRQRGLTFNKDIKDTLALLGDDPTKKHIVPKWFKNHMFSGIVFFQRYVDTATWLAAYQKGRQENAAWTERTLIEYADSTVRRSQASGVFADRTPIERGSISANVRQAELVRIWSTLGSYFFAKGNIAVELTQRTDFKSPKDVSKYAFNMMLLFTVEALLVSLLRNAWPDEDDEDKTVAGHIAKETAKSVLSVFPIVRMAGSEMEGFRGGSTLTSFSETFGRLYTQAEQGEVDVGLFKSLNKMGGIVFKYPSSAINRVVDSAIKDIEGENIGPVDYLVYREKDED